ncbi:nitroreductase/quinone reductase family protein [Streptomyces kurssanovii]|uniref:Nitroreductase/quinone reductase family protein n=1 Tax=Streptomyces kurssanovii TaxID=67312 RepID=A0ABV3HTV5_9ACTN
MADELQPFVADWNRPVVEEFRANGGKVGGPFAGGTLALLTTAGAKSGRATTSPVGYMEIDGKGVVIASAGGGPKNPAWYHNLRANPLLTVEVGTDKYQARATVLEGEEREEVFAKACEIAPGYADYQKNTERIIPVVVLETETYDDGRRARGLGQELTEIHGWLRGEIAELRRQVADFAAGRTDTVDIGDSTLLQQLRDNCLSFCKALEVHHGGEDQGAFPVLESKFPGLAPTLAKLREEHKVVAQLRGDIADLVTRLEPGDPQGLRHELERLTGELERHFDHEEAAVVAALDALAFAPAHRGAPPA